MVTPEFKGTKTFESGSTGKLKRKKGKEAGLGGSGGKKVKP